MANDKNEIKQNNSHSIKQDYLNVLQKTRLENKAPGKFFPEACDDEIAGFLVQCSKQAMLETLWFVSNTISETKDITILDIQMMLCNFVEGLLDDKGDMNYD